MSKRIIVKAAKRLIDKDLIAINKLTVGTTQVNTILCTSTQFKTMIRIVGNLNVIIGLRTVIFTFEY